MPPVRTPRSSAPRNVKTPQTTATKTPSANSQTPAVAAAQSQSVVPLSASSSLSPSSTSTESALASSASTATATVSDAMTIVQLKAWLSQNGVRLSATETRQKKAFLVQRAQQRECELRAPSMRAPHAGSASSPPTPPLASTPTANASLAAQFRAWVSPSLAAAATASMAAPVTSIAIATPRARPAASSLLSPHVQLSASSPSSATSSSVAAPSIFSPLRPRRTSSGARCVQSASAEVTATPRRRAPTTPAANQTPAVIKTPVADTTFVAKPTPVAAIKTPAAAGSVSATVMIKTPVSSSTLAAATAEVHAVTVASSSRMHTAFAIFSFLCAAALTTWLLWHAIFAVRYCDSAILQDSGACTLCPTASKFNHVSQCVNGTLVCSDPTAYAPDARRGLCVLQDATSELQARALSDTMIATLAVDEGSRLCAGTQDASLPLSVTLESLRLRLHAAATSLEAPSVASVLDRAYELAHLAPELDYNLDSRQFILRPAYARIAWSCRVRHLVWRNLGSIIAALTFALLAAFVRARLARRAFITDGSACIADALRAHLSLRRTAMHSESALMSDIGSTSLVLRRFIADAEVWAAAKFCVLSDDRVLSGTRIECGTQVSCLKWVHTSEYVPADAS